MKMSLLEIANAINGVIDSSYGNNEIKLVVTDSRDIPASGASGVLYAAIRGEKVDGHLFVADIVKQGGAALIDKAEFVGKKTIYVNDVKKALGDLAQYFRQQYINDKKLVFITGSVGKTTTKEMTAAAFNSVNTYKTTGNKNSLIGLPLTLLGTPPEAQIIVLEAGMSIKNEIARLSEIAEPDIVIITNIGNAHIESFGCIEHILEEKLSAIKGIKQNGTLILNMDDKLLCHCKDRFSNTVFYSTTNDKAQYYVTDLAYGEHESLFKIKHNNYSAYAAIPTIGEHNVQNALAAFAAADIFGLDRDSIIAGLRQYTTTGNRQRIYQHGSITVIADCYNASPESTKAALTVLKLSKGRKIAVLGDMLELGEQAPRLHKETGANARESGANFLVAIGDYAPYIAEGFNGEHKIFPLDKREEAAIFIDCFLKSGDTVLFKASNRLNFAELIDMIPKVIPTVRVK